MPEKEKIEFEKYLNKDVKVFTQGKSDPITGKVQLIHQKFIVLLAKKAVRSDSTFKYFTRSVKKDKIEKITIL